CLQVRGLPVMALIAALFIYLQYRRTTRRMIVAAACVAAVGVPGLFLASTVRDYSQRVSTSQAVTLALHTPVTAFDKVDLSPFDNFVAIRKLVPSSVSRLDGSTLVDIPA